MILYCNSINVNNTVVLQSKNIEKFPEPLRHKSWKGKAEREPALDLVDNPCKYNRATSYGAAKYVKNLQYDKTTGEIVVTDQKPVFDEEKLREHRLEDAYSVSRIAESLTRVCCSRLEGNWYVFDYADEITKALREKLREALIKCLKQNFSLGERRHNQAFILTLVGL